MNFTASCSIACFVFPLIGVSVFMPVLLFAMASIKLRHFRSLSQGCLSSRGQNDCKMSQGNRKAKPTLSKENNLSRENHTMFTEKTWRQSNLIKDKIDLNTGNEWCQVFHFHRKICPEIAKRTFMSEIIIFTLSPEAEIQMEYWWPITPN